MVDKDFQHNATNLQSLLLPLVAFRPNPECTRTVRPLTCPIQPRGQNQAIPDERSWSKSICMAEVSLDHLVVAQYLKVNKPDYDIYFQWLQITLRLLLYLEVSWM